MKQNSFRTSLFILLCFLLFSGTISQAAEWEMKKGPMMTKWSETIDPNNVLPNGSVGLDESEWSVGSQERCN